MNADGIFWCCFQWAKTEKRANKIASYFLLFKQSSDTYSTAS